MDQKKLTENIETVVREHGAYCVGVAFRGSREKRIVEVYADSETGVGADDLAVISRAVSPVLDAAFPAASEYTLVVSSPGLDQPILHPWQFRRHRGRQVRLTLSASGGSVQRVAVIEDANDTHLTVEGPEGPERIALDTITEALIQPSLKQERR
jgi:ribosome maturation factor RimP